MIKNIKLKILKLFRLLFPSKKQEEKKPFQYLYTKYNSLFSKDIPIICSDDVQELFNEIYNGDVVLAHMPLPKEKLETIPEGHRIRPYYIAYKLKYGFIAYSFSSHNMNWLSDDKTYNLSNYVYDELPKSSYLNLYEPYYLPMDKVIKFICETYDNDFNEIQRRMWINRNREYEGLFKEKPAIYKPIPGDIINRKENNLLVLYENDDSYECLSVCRDEKRKYKSSSFVFCNITKWKVNTSCVITLRKRETLRTSHIVNRDDFNNLKKIIIKTKDDKWACITRGTLFSKKNELFYCYNSFPNCIKAYKVKTNSVNKENLANYVAIENNEDTYYVDPRKSVDINELNDAVIVKKLSNKYIDLIAHAANIAKKAKAKEDIKKIRPKYFTKYNIGTAFKNIYEDEEYVYIYSNRSYDYCIKASEYLNSEEYPEYPLYETRVKELTKTGEIADEDLLQILTDQIRYDNDKEGILTRKRLEIMANVNE